LTIATESASRSKHQWSHWHWQNTAVAEPSATTATNLLREQQTTAGNGKHQQQQWKSKSMSNILNITIIQW